MGLIKAENFIEVPLKDLLPAPWNYKTDNPDLVEKLMANIKRNG